MLRLPCTYGDCMLCCTAIDDYWAARDTVSWSRRNVTAN
jgi:hypothetical protein